MNNILSTRCDPTILNKMKQAAEAEQRSIRQLIEHMWEQYEKQRISKQLRASFAKMWKDEINLAEEDMQNYFIALEKIDAH